MTQWKLKPTEIYLYIKANYLFEPVLAVQQCSWVWLKLWNSINAFSCVAWLMSMLKIFLSLGRPTPTVLTCDTFENIFVHSPHPFVLLLFLIGALKLLPTYTSGSNIGQKYWTYFVFICTADLDLERLPAFFKTGSIISHTNKNFELIVIWLQ